MLNRIQIIQRLIRATGARTYLEIGVNTGTCFLRIKASRKLGVDPDLKIPVGRRLKYFVKNPTNLNSQYFEETSDDFFEKHADLLRAHRPEIVFIDGLHTYEQSLRDVLNSLKFLAEDGFILMHDCNPLTKAAAYPARSFEDVVSLNLPDYGGIWNGDVWKSIVHLRSLHRDLDVCVLNCDHGIGVLRRGDGTSGASLSADTIAGLTYEDLAANREQLLNLKSPEFLDKIIAGVVTRRKAGPGSQRAPAR
ncbi:MAG TPA: class I SAM-dependent methyltransferase [Chryseosolibacter sp.]|nr:class I SAM-dependent methyltransferase [Chryseosolibacter sp.]